jgi:hypothetical protein
MERFNLALEAVKKAGNYLKEKFNVSFKLKEFRYDIKLNRGY